MPDTLYLLPASSWARLRKTDDAPIPAPKLPPHVTRVAADSGGFVAAIKNNGVYRYTPEQYVAWLRSFNPTWAAMMDFCCEPEIAGREGIVRERQAKTTAMAHRLWAEYKRESWCWVPTIQGWDLDDYQRHARELRMLISEMAEYYGPGSEFRVGIGTLCRRADILMIQRVVNAVAAELPGISLHLWGVKLSIMQSKQPLPDSVISVDSAAWNGLFGHGRSAYRQSGLTQRQYVYQIALPAYQAKLETALATPRQHRLFD